MSQRNVWLMPYGNFDGGYYNPSWGLAWRVKEFLHQVEGDQQYACRVKRVGVNIYDADEAVDEVQFLDKSGISTIDIVIAFGVGGPDDLFNFEYTGDASRNDMGTQYDLYGRQIGDIKEYGPSICGEKAGWHKIPAIKDLVYEYDRKAGQKEPSTGAGNYLCGYMTEKLATSNTLKNKGFFIHTTNFKPQSEADVPRRDKAARLIVDFIQAFCDLKK